MTHLFRLFLLISASLLMAATVRRESLEEPWSRDFILNGTISKNGIPLKNANLYLTRRYKNRKPNGGDCRVIVTDDLGYYSCIETVFIPSYSAKKEIWRFMRGDSIILNEKLYSCIPQVFEFTHDRKNVFKPSPCMEVAGRYFVEQVPNVIVVRMDVDFKG